MRIRKTVRAPLWWLLATFAAGGLSVGPVWAEAKKPASSSNGKYTDKDGNPTYNVTDGGKKVDWYTYSGFRHYHADCHTCHGPDGMGSTYAPVTWMICTST